MLKNLIGRAFRRPKSITQDEASPITAVIRIPRDQHPVSRSIISNATLKTLYGLRDAGYEGYMVGGGVRDILAGLKPKDFDIATNARPEQIKQVFRSCRLVGRRFVIAHVRFGSEIIEVTTFRGELTDSHERDETGRILSDNVYGADLEADARRRDFTVNGLYYDIRDYSIVDYVGGMADMKARKIRLIGDPELRYREDPVRMLRAVRIANKLGFEIEPGTRDVIPRLASLLNEVPAARLFDEVVKLLLTREALANFRGLRELGLFAQLFPQTEALLGDQRMLKLLESALEGTAARIEAEQPVSPAFLYATLLWAPVAQRAAELEATQGYPPSVALTQAADGVLAQQVMRVAIPKRFSGPAREIWLMQPRFAFRRGKRPARLMAHPRFRAAYDFLCLRAATGEADQELADWWTEAQKGEDAVVPEVPAHAPASPARRRRRRRGGRGRSPSA
jgi:poly(A) polymerase